ncbi:MAG: 2-aminoethylphosphonate ABC transporter permease subunit [Acetobacteraceae bacterium]
MASLSIPIGRRASPGRGGLWIAPPALVLAILFFYPLALIAGASFSGSGGRALLNYAGVLDSAEFVRALWHTVEIAVASSVGCLVLGLVLSMILAFVPFPGSRVLARVIDTFIALPTFLMALAFTFIYGTTGIFNAALMEALHLQLPPLDFLYSQWGVILAEVTVYTPFVMRPLLASFSLIERSQIEVASSLGAGAFRIMRQVILPAAIPALLAGGSLCLLLTTNEFGIVLFIGAKGVVTLPLLIYIKAIQEFDYTGACVLAVINIALSLSLYSLYRSTLSWFGGRSADLG